VSVIVKGQQGMQFMSMTLGELFLGSDPQIRHDWDSIDWWAGGLAGEPVALGTVLVDSEGQKYAPHVCLACHGGVFDPTTSRVQGASLLPLDPNVLAFGVTQAGDRTRYERPYQEENIRRINTIILGSGPSQAVADYIRGLYPYGVAQAGATAKPDFVP